ncbi:MAG: glycosyltransferase [Halioglobus sp.]|nr:glycosyltransferase [Halioglobus sp.]|tara:strand:+ start:2815 stop:3789 length:975 start_codon:yes stop_codon:yes gene_type:complete
MKQDSQHRTLSVVVPVFNEEAAVPELLRKISQAIAGTGLGGEIVVVDDGSTDSTWALLRECADSSPYPLELVRFTRNFGKEAAIMAGLERCRGDAAIVLDADLQHPPDMLGAMVDLWRSGEADVVDAVKTDDRHAPPLDRVTSALFNRAFQRVTGYDMRGATDYKLLDRRVIQVLSGLRDYHLFFRGTTAWLGFRHREIGFPLGPRAGGSGKWNTRSRLQLAITALTSHTALPLQLMTVVGLLSALLAVFHASHTLYYKFSGQAVEGFTTVILLLLIFGSTITLGLGIIGAYLSRIYDEVRGRPRYLVEEHVRIASDSARSPQH